MEWKLGEIKQIDGEMYQCVRGQSGEKCIGCSFKFSSICIYFHCLESERKDHMKVIFKKLKKLESLICIRVDLFNLIRGIMISFYLSMEVTLLIINMNKIWKL